MLKKTLTAAALSASLAAGAAEAEIVVDFREVGSDVIGTVSGTLDPTGTMISIGTGRRTDGGPVMNPADGILLFFDAASGAIPRQWETASGSKLPSFGTGTGGNLGTYTGTSFGMLEQVLWLPLSPAPMTFNGTWTIPGESFTSLGITPGTYNVVDALGPVLSLSFTAAEVPLPAGLPLLLGGLGALGLVRRRARG